jgi:clathrin heavy chain
MLIIQLIDISSFLPAGRTLQVFNIETKQKVKSHVNNEDIVFWKWVSETTVRMVTDTSVYHWGIENQQSQGLLL